MTAEGVLVLYEDDLGTVQSTYSAVMFDENVVLLHGAALLPLDKIVDHRQWLKRALADASSQLKAMPFIDEYIRFQVLRPCDVVDVELCRPGRRMVTAGVWSSSLAKIGDLQPFKETESLKELAELYNTFIFLKPFEEDRGPLLDIDFVKRILHGLLSPILCQNVIVETTPFGRPSVINSVSTGIISSLFGPENSLFLTDAFTPSGSGGAVYSVIHEGNVVRKGLLLGIISHPLVDFESRCLGLTLGISLMPVLRRLLLIRPAMLPTITVSDLLNDALVLIRSGTLTGSGTVINAASGVIITCSHVIEDDDNITIFLLGRTYPCDLIYKTKNNEVYDLAVIKVSIPNNLKSEMELTDAPVCIGDTVYAAGFPKLGLSDADMMPTVTVGCISKLNSGQIQTSCTVNRGQSGGPLIKNGKMLGVIVCHVKNGSDFYPRLSFCVPTSAFLKPIKKYIETGVVEHLHDLECKDVIVQRIWKSKF